MRLVELQKFRRTSGGEVPHEVLQRLQIPAPAEVLEQFLVDHGLKGHIQRQFGDVDIHRVSWQQVAVPVHDLLLASVDRECECFVLDRAKEARSGGLTAIGRRYAFQPDVKGSWETMRTWARIPLAFAGNPMRWIEGHTRLGYLRGLVEDGHVADDSTHAVWVGHQDALSPSAVDWQAVLADEHITFSEWLILAQGEGTPKGRFGDRLVSARYGHPRRDFEDTFAGVASSLGPSDDLARAHAEWLAFVGGNGGNEPAAS